MSRLFLAILSCYTFGVLNVSALGVKLLEKEVNNKDVILENYLPIDRIGDQKKLIQEGGGGNDQ